MAQTRTSSLSTWTADSRSLVYPGPWILPCPVPAGLLRRPQPRLGVAGTVTLNCLSRPCDGFIPVMKLQGTLGGHSLLHLPLRSVIMPLNSRTCQ